MAGTFYRHHTADVSAMAPTEGDTQRLLNQINSALPSAQLTPDDVTRIHAGLLPCEPGRPADSDPKLRRHYMLVDHAERDALEGLITTLGVKYTTARDVAERTINLAARKLGQAIRPSSSATAPLPAGDRDVRSAIHGEMAQTLTDVVYRRTGLGATGVPPEEMLQACAKTMAQELGWDADRLATEITAVREF
jgi:glycerol-3-phosphate dehydrogenase